MMSTPEALLCHCRLCGGRAKLLESRPHKNGSGRRRRYGCREAGCGFRWSEWEGERSSESLRQSVRAAGAVGALHLCSTCTHWLADRCGLGFPEAATDPTFASLCAAWLERGSRLDPADAEP